MPDAVLERSLFDCQEEPMTTATITTDKGDIVMELFADRAPRAVANFVDLAKKGYYDGVVFHRVVPGFVIQGGDGQYGHIDSLNTGRLGTGGPGYTFPDEPVVGRYERGSVAMANAGPNTNGSQFFICLQDLPTLPKQYTLFGQVTSGMDVVDQIAAAPRGANDRPVEPTAMKTVTVAE
jgi:cyclophilin family peptidyl-prolyl cis-trans isomerase